MRPNAKAEATLTMSTKSASPWPSVGLFRMKEVFGLNRTVLKSEVYKRKQFTSDNAISYGNAVMAQTLKVKSLHAKILK